MYDLKQIEQLAQQYNTNPNDNTFELIIEAIVPLINIQLNKSYLSLREYWDDMSQEVLLKLWKNRTGLCFTSTERLYRYLYQQIHRNLFRAAEKIKKEYMTENVESLDNIQVE